MYKVITERGVSADFKKISVEIVKRIVSKIYDKLPHSPRIAGKALTGPRRGQYSLKCYKDYRVIYRIIESDRTVIVISVGRRREVYD